MLSLLLAGTEMENCPSPAVTAPTFFEPSTLTVAPMIGEPLASVILPVTVRFCAIAIEPATSAVQSVSAIFFTINLSLLVNNIIVIVIIES